MPRQTISNRILSSLTRADLRLIEPHLTAVDLPLRRQLETRKKYVESAYFLDSGLASVIADGEHAIEVGMIGREGMTGLSIVMGSNRRAPYDTYMQIAGQGHRISAGELRRAMEASASLHRVMLRAAYAFMMQTTQTAAANGRSKIEERLARWLLMADDRIGGSELRLTHEFLALMLGVRRSGVTAALQGLQRLGLISHRRSVISILDREALKRSSNGTYVAADRD